MADPAGANKTRKFDNHPAAVRNFAGGRNRPKIGEASMKTSEIRKLIDTTEPSGKKVFKATCVSGLCSTSLHLWPEKHKNCTVSWCECECHERSEDEQYAEMMSMYGG